MSVEPRVRPAGPADAELLAELALRTFNDAFAGHPLNRPEDMAAYTAAAFAPARVRAELADPAVLYLLADVGGEVAGYAQLRFGPAEPGVTADRPAELGRLYAEQRFLGRGVGPALLTACLAEAARRACDVLWLGVWEHNPRAQAFYRKWGFEFVGSHTFLLGSDPQTDLLMQRPVAAPEPSPGGPV